MKNEFIGFYEPSSQEIEQSWKEGVFAFDANSLLNLYRYTVTTRNDFLTALTKLKNRLFIPHQAGLEFHSNRINVIDDQEKAHQKLLDFVKENYEKTVAGQINEFKRHPSISIERITKLLEEFLKKIENELENQKKEHPDFKTKDDILDAVTTLFDKCVGPKFSRKELNAIFEEGRERYAAAIPPGYKDGGKKKGDQSIYGDLIIWKELINYSKANKRVLIFVTDDRKEDWWTIHKGKTLRPREELIKEFFDVTGTRILIYNADSFLQYANEKKFVTGLKKETIEEISKIRKSDEKTNAVIDYVLSQPNWWKLNAVQTGLEAQTLENIRALSWDASGFKPDPDVFQKVRESLAFNPDPDVFKKVKESFAFKLDPDVFQKVRESLAFEPDPDVVQKVKDGLSIPSQAQDSVKLPAAKAIDAQKKKKDTKP